MEVFRTALGLRAPSDERLAGDHKPAARPFVQQTGFFVKLPSRLLWLVPEIGPSL